MNSDEIMDKDRPYLTIKFILDALDDATDVVGLERVVDETLAWFKQKGVELERREP